MSIFWSLATKRVALNRTTRLLSTKPPPGTSPPAERYRGIDALAALTEQTAASQLTALPPPPPKLQILEIPPAEDPLLRYFASALVRDGKRAKANIIVARTLLHIYAFTRAPPLEIFREALHLTAPAVRCMIHRHGTKNVAKPVALGERQRMKFAVRWILEASEGKPGRKLEERLAREMISVIQGSSSALRTKEAVHKYAMVNRGNASSRS